MLRRMKKGNSNQPVSIHQDHLDNAAQCKPKNIISLLAGDHNCLNWNISNYLCLDITKYCQIISHSKSKTCIKSLLVTGCFFLSL